MKIIIGFSFILEACSGPTPNKVTCMRVVPKHKQEENHMCTCVSVY